MTNASQILERSASMPAVDPLNALLELVRAAARDGTTDALALRRDPHPTAPPSPLLDKRALAHALGVSTATVDRLCRQGRIPFVLVGEVRRFDLEAVRSALAAHWEQAKKPIRPGPGRTEGSSPIPGVRLLSRGRG
jgi:excisionase family DNA binding protein